jgi:putative transposase
MKERKTRYAIYNINYHIVWIPKYRKRVLVGEVRDHLVELFRTTASQNDIEILGFEVMPDHVHLFVSAPPRFAPSQVVNMFKGVSARWLRERFPELKKLGDVLWTRTYYVGTAGAVTSETIQRYIAEQTARA